MTTTKDAHDSRLFARRPSLTVKDTGASQAHRDGPCAKCSGPNP